MPTPIEPRRQGPATAAPGAGRVAHVVEQVLERGKAVGSRNSNSWKVLGPERAAVLERPSATAVIADGVGESANRYGREATGLNGCLDRVNNIESRWSKPSWRLQ